MVRLKQDGMPIVGFTWYSLTDQVDWDTALREDAGRVNPWACTISTARSAPSGISTATLLRQWRDFLSDSHVALVAAY